MTRLSRSSLLADFEMTCPRRVDEHLRSAPPHTVVRLAKHWIYSRASMPNMGRAMRRPLPILKLSDRFGDYTLTIKCRCGHVRSTDPHALAKILGWDAPLVNVGARMRCSRCGKKECELVPESIPRPRGVPKNPH